MVIEIKMLIGLRMIRAIEDIAGSAKFKQHIAILCQTGGQSCRDMIGTASHHRSPWAQASLHSHRLAHASYNCSWLAYWREDSKINSSMLEIRLVPAMLVDIVEPALCCPILL